MRIGFLGVSFAVLAAAPLALAADPALPPPLWASKPDIAAFQKTGDAHIDAAKKSIDAIVAAKGKRTIDNTLVPYDEATRELDSAIYFAYLMEQVAADGPYRDAATAMRGRSAPCRPTSR